MQWRHAFQISGYTDDTYVFGVRQYDWNSAITVRRQGAVSISCLGSPFWILNTSQDTRYSNLFPDSTTIFRLQLMFALHNTRNIPVVLTDRENLGFIVILYTAGIPHSMPQYLKFETTILDLLFQVSSVWSYNIVTILIG